MKFALVLIFSSSAFAQILFLDINNNTQERKVAIEAAKKAGKTIHIYPTGEEKFEKEKAFLFLKDKKPDSLFISGHNGGGSFSGDRGENFSFEELKKFTDINPEIGTQLRSLGLLGCNTGNHAQVSKWKKAFPNLAFIAGYDGTAPLGTRPAGHFYIEDIITKTDQIIKETDANEIKNIFQNFKGVYNIYASLFVDINTCQEVENDQYIFRPLRKARDRFKLFDTAECRGKREEYNEKHSDVYDKYFNGNAENSKGVLSEELKLTYTFLRQNEHCFEDFIEDGRDSYNPDHMLLLLFNSNIYENTLRYYKEPLETLFNELKIFGSKEKLNKQHLKLIAKKEQLYNKAVKYVADYKNYKKDLDKYIFKFEKELDSFPYKYKLKFEALIKQHAQLGEAVATRNFDEYEKINPDFRKYVQKKMTLDELKKTAKDGITSAPYQGLQSYQVKYYKEDLQRAKDLNLDRFIIKYEKLSTKNYEDLKDLSRKQMANVIHTLNSFEVELTENPDKTHRTISVFAGAAYHLNPSQIPFSWHDSQIEDIQEPTDLFYRVEGINAVESRDHLLNFFDQ